MNTIPFCDELMNEYYELSGVSDIPNMQGYANDWLDLAAKMSTEGRTSMAGKCADHYIEYSRLAPYIPSAKVTVEGNCKRFDQ